jgi:hypothetical protein
MQSWKQDEIEKLARAIWLREQDILDHPVRDLRARCPRS